MTYVAECTLKVLAHLSVKYQKAYVFPTQEKILELLDKYHKVKISRRALNYILKWLRAYGYFNRIKRHYRGPNGKLVLRSTLYIVRAKMVSWLYKLKAWVKKILIFYAVQPIAQYSLNKTVSSSVSCDLPTGYQQPTAKKSDFPIKLEDQADKKYYEVDFYERRTDEELSRDG